MTAPLVCLTDVRQQLSDAFALHVADLPIPTGAVSVLLGPTGAGKTTLLRLLTGLEAPDVGAVHWNTTTPAPSIAMVHQKPLLLAGTVQHNVEYGLRLKKTARLSSEQIDERVQQVLEPLQLASRARQDARTLSGGQIQLVGLARALILEPALLLLDEPTANLDPAHVALAERAIMQLAERNGTTIVLATHNLFQARRLAQHVTLLLDGQVVESAVADSFFHHPRDPRTTSFLQGEMIY